MAMMGEILGAISRSLREGTNRIMMGTNYVASLSSDSDEVVMSTLEEMCTQLNMSTLLPFFRHNTTEIIPCLTKCIQRSGNIDMNLLSARVVTYFIDRFPPAIPLLSEEENLESILHHLKVMQDIELSEQCLTCLEKICDHPAGVRGMYKRDGISAMLTFADFFTINSQRKIWSNTAKICKAVKPRNFDSIRSVLPTIRAGVTSEDLFIRESAIRAIVRIVIGVGKDPDLVDEAFGDLCPTLVLILLTPEKDERSFFGALQLIHFGVGYSLKVLEKVVSDEALYSLLTLLSGAAAAASSNTLFSPAESGRSMGGSDMAERSGNGLPSKFSSFPPSLSTAPSSSASSPISPDAPPARVSAANRVKGPRGREGGDSLLSPSPLNGVSFLLRDKKIKLSMEDTRLLSNIFAFLLPAVTDVKAEYVSILRAEELKIYDDLHDMPQKVGSPAMGYVHGRLGVEEQSIDSDNEMDYSTFEDGLAMGDTYDEEGEEEEDSELEEEEESGGMNEEDDWGMSETSRNLHEAQNIPGQRVKDDDTKKEREEEEEEKVEEEKAYRDSIGQEGGQGLRRSSKEEGLPAVGTRKEKKGENSLSPTQDNDIVSKEGNKGEKISDEDKNWKDDVRGTLYDLGTLIENDTNCATLQEGLCFCDRCSCCLHAEDWYHCNACINVNFCGKCLLAEYRKHRRSHTFTDVKEAKKKAREEAIARQRNAIQWRLELYTNKPALLERVLMAIPGVVQLSAETEVPSIRYYCLEYLIRAVHLASASQLLDAGITSTPICESLSIALQHPFLLAYLGIYLSHQLACKMPSIFKDMFLREGVVSVLQKLHSPFAHSCTVPYPPIVLTGTGKRFWKNMIAERASNLLSMFPPDCEAGRSQNLLHLCNLLQDKKKIIPAFIFLRQIMLMGVTTFELVTTNVIHDLKEALVRRHSILDILAMIHILSVAPADTRMCSSNISTSTREASDSNMEPHSLNHSDMVGSFTSSAVLRSTSTVTPLVRFVRHLQGILTFFDDFKLPSSGAISNMRSTVALKISPDVNEIFFPAGDSNDTTRRAIGDLKEEQETKANRNSPNLSGGGDGGGVAATAAPTGTSKVAARSGLSPQIPENPRELFSGVVSVDPLVDMDTLTKCVTRELVKGRRKETIWNPSMERLEENSSTSPEESSSHIQLLYGDEEQEVRGPNLSTPAGGSTDDGRVTVHVDRDERRPSRPSSMPIWLRYKNKVLPPSMTVIQFFYFLEKEKGEAVENANKNISTTTSSTRISPSMCPDPRNTHPSSSTTAYASGMSSDVVGEISPTASGLSSALARGTSPSTKGSTTLTSQKKSSPPCSPPIAVGTSTSGNPPHLPHHHNERSSTVADERRRSRVGWHKRSSEGQAKSPQPLGQEENKKGTGEQEEEGEENEREVEDNGHGDVEDEEEVCASQLEDIRQHLLQHGLPTSLLSALSSKKNKRQSTTPIPELHYSLTPYVGPSYEFISPTPPIPDEVRKAQSILSLVLPSEEHYYPPSARPVLQRLSPTFPWSRSFLTTPQMEVLTVLGVLVEAIQRWDEIAPELEMEVLAHMKSEDPNETVGGGGLPYLKTTNSDTCGMDSITKTSTSSTTMTTEKRSEVFYPAEMPATWLHRLCPPSISLREFCHQKLNNKAMQHCSNFLLAGQHLRTWAVNLALDCGFLFLPSTRKFMFDISFCGTGRSLVRMQQKIEETGFLDRSSPDHRMQLSVNLHRIRFSVSRKNILSSAVELFYGIRSPGSVVWDIDFRNEEGLGTGPTKEFYTLVANALRLRLLNLWRGSDEPSSSTHFTAPHGLYPRLMPPSHSCAAGTMDTSSSKVAGSPSQRKPVDMGPFLPIIAMRNGENENGKKEGSPSISSVPSTPPLFGSGEPSDDLREEMKRKPQKNKTSVGEKKLSEKKLLGSWFELVGRFIARALLDEHLPSLVLSPALLRLLRGDTCSLRDVRDVDPTLYQLLLDLVRAYRNHADYVELGGVSKRYTVEELGLDFTVDGIPLFLPSREIDTLHHHRQNSQQQQVSSASSVKGPSSGSTGRHPGKKHSLGGSSDVRREPAENGATLSSSSPSPFSSSSCSSSLLSSSLSLLPPSPFPDPSSPSISDTSLPALNVEKTKAMSDHAAREEEVAEPMLRKENIMLYCDAMVETLLRSGVKTAVLAMRKGFDELIPLYALQMLTVEELHEVINGDDHKVNREEISENCFAKHGYSISSKPIQWFFDILASFTVQEQRKFFSFLTGSEHLPIGGLASLNPKLTIVRKTSVEPNVKESDQLPSAMTCQNYLKLPAYESKEQMEAKIRQAMMEGQGSFHLT